MSASKQPDEFDRRAKATNRSKCFWNFLTDEQRQRISDARGRGHTVATIARVLREDWKVRISDCTVRRHFNGGCLCDR